MKYAKRLETEAVSEWRPKYLQYRQLKKLIKNVEAAREAHSRKSFGDLEKNAVGPLCTDEQLFLQLLDVELVKIEEFYRAREGEALDKKRRIMAQLDILPEGARSGTATSSPTTMGAGDRETQLTWRSLQGAASTSPTSPNGLLRSPISSGKGGLPAHLNISSLRRSSFTHLARLRIKKALLEYYRSLELVRNFKSLNVLAVTKILKKFDKNSGRRMSIVYADKLRSYTFYTSDVINGLMDDVENIYRCVFTGGDKSRALRKLRVKDLKKKSFHGSAMISGIFLMATLALVWRAVILVIKATVPTTKALGVIYVGLGLPALMAWLFAVNAEVWEAFYINYRFIFEYNQRTNLHICQYSTLVGFFSLLYAGLALMSLEGWVDGLISPMLQPWVVLTCLLAVFLWPGNQFYRPSRIWFARVFVRILTVPFYPCRFKDFFINDQYMSLVATFDVLGRLIYFSHQERVINPYARPAVWYIFGLQMLPALWRSLQCLRRYKDSRMSFPHLTNLAKYLCSLSVPLLDGLMVMSRYETVFTCLLIVARAVSSTFSLGWDIVMDFGLWQRSAVNDRLRSTILFSPWIYWYLIISDTIARYLWILPLLQAKLFPTAFPPILLTLALWTAEVLRRFQWNFFRVEYEHVNNCNVLRAVADVQLPFTATDLFYQDMVETIQHQQQEKTNRVTEHINASSPSGSSQDEEEEEEDGGVTANSSFDGEDECSDEISPQMIQKTTTFERTPMEQAEAVETVPSGWSTPRSRPPISPIRFSPPKQHP